MNGTIYIPLLVEQLKKADPEKIILFGSYAYGEPNEDSDLDIMVITSTDIVPKNYKEKSKLYLAVSRTISDIRKNFPIDLIVHTKPMHEKFLENNSLFAQELQLKGVILYEKNN